MKSRGMGSIMPSKMPGKKIIHRTDNPNDVEMYAAGGKITAENYDKEYGKIYRKALKNKGK